MNFTLTRTEFLQAGIFGQMTSQDQSLVLQTLEHSYEIKADGPPGPSVFEPKMPPGVYTCQRRLSPHFGYEVFQVLNVPGAEFIEIHKGNTEKSSAGCVLVGLAREGIAVIHSAAAFEAFMNLQSDVQEFQLIVT